MEVLRDGNNNCCLWLTSGQAGGQKNGMEGQEVEKEGEEGRGGRRREKEGREGKKENNMHVN